MSDPVSLIAAGMATLAGLTLIGTYVLKAWDGWLDLKRMELGKGRGDARPPSPIARIELADLKERVRKLEAIASGIQP
jgi:hypothetical protein